jgi:hypothetical protein
MSEEVNKMIQEAAKATARMKKENPCKSNWRCAYAIAKTSNVSVTEILGYLQGIGINVLNDMEIAEKILEENGE